MRDPTPTITPPLENGKATPNDTRRGKLQHRKEKEKEEEGESEGEEGSKQDRYS